ncbi:hypothetical protein BRADI_4g19445v3 [Brachypodium distachyon]|uniref:Uncharacterized protein n=1 Tax=Brachypodium distachyon TaxID=15368 RepID=A0A2K2CNP5_BRADI|nr:hypothetical protein BRADI_4g19445v3 [Brachypodium distachyon]
MLVGRCFCMGSFLLIIMWFFFFSSFFSFGVGSHVAVFYNNVLFVWKTFHIVHTYFCFLDGGGPGMDF